MVFIFRSFECFAAILDSLQTGRIGARMRECQRGWGGGERKIKPSPSPHFSFSLPHLVNFLPRANSPLFFNSRWWPEHLTEIYIHSPRQNPPPLQASVKEIISLLKSYAGSLQCNPQCSSQFIAPFKSVVQGVPL